MSEKEEAEREGRRELGHNGFGESIAQSAVLIQSDRLSSPGRFSKGLPPRTGACHTGEQVLEAGFHGRPQDFELSHKNSNRCAPVCSSLRIWVAYYACYHVCYNHIYSYPNANAQIHRHLGCEQYPLSSLTAQPKVADRSKAIAFRLHLEYP